MTSIRPRLKAYFALGVAVLLLFVAIGVQVVTGGIAREREAIQASALAQGYWIARSFELGHRARVEEEKKLLEELTAEIARHDAVLKIAIINGRGQVLISNKPQFLGTRIVPEEDVPKSGLVIGGDSRMPEMMFPLHFADAHGRPGGRQVHTRYEGDVPQWVVIQLDASESYSHYRRSVQQSALILAASVGLILASFGAFWLFRRFMQASALATQHEQARRGLERFVPRTVRERIAEDPALPFLEKVERDATVLFLDIEGYSRLAQTMNSADLNRLMERYFSAFLDPIHAHGGEVNETAGDGMMAIFTSDDGNHALNAVKAALAIRERTLDLGNRRAPEEPELRVNVGVNTGTVLLGATTIRATSGDRLTYTASGNVTNVAARLCQLADGGEIRVGESTALQVQGEIPLVGPETVALRNIGGPLRVYRVK